MATFKDPFEPDRDLELADAGFSHNYPFDPMLARDVDVIISLDASCHRLEATSLLDRPGAATRLDAAAVAGELKRSKLSAARVFGDSAGGRTLPPIDVRSYVSQPVSFHRDLFGDGPLLVSMHLGKLDDADAFCPLKNAHAGGFCANSTASYEPGDFDRLADFARRRLRGALPAIRKHVGEHLRHKRDRGLADAIRRRSAEEPHSPIETKPRQRRPSTHRDLSTDADAGRADAAGAPASPTSPDDFDLIDFVGDHRRDRDFA